MATALSQKLSRLIPGVQSKLCHRNSKNRHAALNQPRLARNRRRNWANARRLVGALDLLQLADGDMGITLRGRQRGMSEIGSGCRRSENGGLRLRLQSALRAALSSVGRIIDLFEDK